MVSIFSLYPYNPLLYSSPSSLRNFLECHFSSNSNSNSASSSFDGRAGGGGGGGGSKVLLLVAAAHSNPNILKTNRKSKYGYPLSTYDSDDDDDDDDDDDEDDDDDGDWLSDEEFAEPARLDTNGKRSKFNAMKGKERQNEKEWGVREFDNEPSTRMRRSKGVASLRKNYNRKLDDLKEKKYPRLSEEIILDSRWLPLLDYLSTFGIKESHFIQMYQRHMPSLQINVCSAQERLDYLMSVGVKHRDVRRILVRQPQILGYTVENNLKSHVAFLTGLGIPSSRVGQIIAAAPSLFSYSVENSLKPTVRYLVEQVGIKEKDLGKVIQLSPQILVQRIDVSWNTRYMFLTKELGAPKDSIVKMVTKHPQLLHYSIDDGLLPRINFLRSIGMKNSDILKVLTSLTQVLSLSLEDNLKPKYLYLVNELNNEVQSLTKYPMYLSLSLDQRIRPRHRFLVSLKKAPKGPFPLGSLVPTDECFCQQWAGTSLDKYLAFRQRLLVRRFAEKFESKM